MTDESILDLTRKLDAIAAISFADDSIEFSDDCIDDENLASLVDGELPVKSRSNIYNHLGSCEYCYSRWMSARSAYSEVLTDPSQQGQRESINELNWFSQWFKPLVSVAALAMFALAITPTFFSGYSSHDSRIETLANSDYSLNSVTELLNSSEAYNGGFSSKSLNLDHNKRDVALNEFLRAKIQLGYVGTLEELEVGLKPELIRNTINENLSIQAVDNITEECGRRFGRSRCEALGVLLVELGRYLLTAIAACSSGSLNSDTLFWKGLIADIEHSTNRIRKNELIARDNAKNLKDTFPELYAFLMRDLGEGRVFCEQCKLVVREIAGS